MSATSFIALGVLLLILIPIVHFDLQERRIPNALNVLLATAGFLFQTISASSVRAALIGLVAPVAIIALFLGLIAIMKLLRRQGTLGLGDVKFLAAASLWVGFIGSTAVFVIASLFSVGFIVARSPWRRLDLRGAIPFAPFLAAGLLVVYGLGTVSQANKTSPAIIVAPAS
jgi:leader peptidase (prepilin peptidase)/N-methyltransferase